MEQRAGKYSVYWNHNIQFTEIDNFFKKYNSVYNCLLIDKLSVQNSPKMGVLCRCQKK